MASRSLSIAISPGSQEVSLVPGETYEGSFTVLNPFPDAAQVGFRVRVAPMTSEDETFSLDFDDATDFSQIVNWVTLEPDSGALDGHTSTEIHYRISVPADAPAGGQYAAFLVQALPNDPAPAESSTATVKSSSQIAMLLYATVAGETRIEGTVVEHSLAPVYLDAPLKTTLLLSNTGNVHSRATVTLRVFPLFSSEEVYSTEETPTYKTVLPGSRLLFEQVWDETPKLGLYRVEEEVDFAGIYTVESRVVLFAPFWFVILAFLFLVAIFYGLIERLSLRKKSKKKVRKKS